MQEQNELQFLRDVLRKCHVSTALLAGDGRHSLDEQELGPLPAPALPEARDAQTLYKLTDPCDLSYLFFRLTGEGAPILLIGPYLGVLPTRERLLEIGERLGISPAQQARFEEYYLSLPLLAEGDRLFSVVTGFCERLWSRPSFAIVDVSRAHDPASAPLAEAKDERNTLDDTLVAMKTMERRYSFENELMHAVTLGQLHKEEQLLSHQTDSIFERRVADPLRNAKNYCIIMNTLLRKAAEQGGVHPVYLDRVSSGFAAQIEGTPSFEEIAPLMREMFRSYCRLVRRHAMTHYSLTVQKTVLLIDADLSAPLTLKHLAAEQKVSCGYLSTLFKRETGKTVTEYVRMRRMKHAAHLLATTQLQIQTIALHCGILDVHYFTKSFKRETGKTPKEYREAATAHR